MKQRGLLVVFNHLNHLKYHYLTAVILSTKLEFQYCHFEMCTLRIVYIFNIVAKYTTMAPTVNMTCILEILVVLFVSVSPDAGHIHRRYWLFHCVLKS